VSFDCTKAAPSAELVAAGMVLGTIVKIPPMCVVEGWVTVASIPALASLASVKKIDLPHYRTPRHHIPLHNPTPGAGASATSAIGSTTIDGNGITIMAADQFVTNTGVSGAGVTVGIISDDVQSITVIQGRGELPTVNIVKPSANPTTHPTFTDEGTMMLEEVHAAAPAASLAFCGPETYAEYVGCATNLIAAGVTIVSDDVSYSGFDTMSAQSPETQAVQTLLTSNPNVMLFTASANQQQNYWQGPYTPDNSSGASFTCNGQMDTYFESFGQPGVDVNVWTMSGATSSLLALAWADPFGANVSNFDLYVLDTTGAFVACAPGAGSTDTEDWFPDGTIASPGNYWLVIGTPDASLQGKFLKLIGTGDGAASFSLNTPGAPSSPQDFATGAFTIGAVDGSDGVGANIEPYSDMGPIQLPLSIPSTLQAPIVAAPDGIYVDTAGTTFQPINGLFYGTSAASPNTAAVAALLRSAFPALTPTGTITAIETGATAIAAYGAVPNGTIGYGRVDAMGALATLPAPTISGAASLSLVGGSAPSQLSLTLSGTGALTMSASSDNSALLPSVSFNSGCTSSGNGCGATINPVFGHSGTAHLTLTVADGAKRTASLVATVTVAKPAPPQVLVTGEPSQVVNMGAAVAPATVVPSGVGTLAVSASSSNQGLLANSALKLSGAPCGTSGAACILNMTPTVNQAGTAVVTVTAKDAYGQSGQGRVTVTINAPPPSGGGSGGGGGGGALDLAALAALGGLLLDQQRRFRSRGRPIPRGLACHPGRAASSRSPSR
jgi:hypothetical protein